MRRTRLGLALSSLCLGIAQEAPGAEPPATRDAAWLARAQRGLAEREYRASENGAGLQAPNRAHGLRTWFDKAGIRVHDRSAGGSPELLRLSLAAVGRGETPAAVPAAEAVVAQQSRVEIQRPGLVEWYVNSPAGLEQGFTLAERPAGEGPLVVELAVAGAEPRLRGEAIVFAAAQRKLRYGALTAADATGRTLAARLELPGPERLRIVVEDAAASYPLVIDPLLTEMADTQLEGGLSLVSFGDSVAGAGDVNGDGYADVIVGAFDYDNGQVIGGGAFVFHGSASGIADGDPSTAATELLGNQSSQLFGESVAGAGDVNGDGYADVIVGARLYDGGQTNEGAVFVFHGSASGIADGNQTTAATQIESDQVGADFGVSVAGAGDVNGDGYADVIVGSGRGSGGYDNGELDEGAAFVFHGSAAGIPDGDAADAAAQLESNQVGAGLGVSVAGAGDVNGDGYADVIVGAEEYGNGEAGEGAAFVFHGSATGVADGSPALAAAELQSDQAGASLGVSVAGAGDVNGDGYADVIVGADDYDAGEVVEGAAFVFHGSASGIADGNPGSAWAQLESDQVGAGFGGSVAGAGDVNGDGYADVIVGAPYYDSGEGGEGAAFVFLGSVGGVSNGNPATAAAQLESDQVEALLGVSVAGAGDVNGDGYADVIGGARFYNAGQVDEGAAFVFHGGADGIASGNGSYSSQIDSDQGSADLGLSVAGAGDVNGDGYADVIVGADDYDAGETDEGAAFVFLGFSSGIDNSDEGDADAQLESNQASAHFGVSVAGAGDVNGDGYADVIVGADDYDSGQTEEGAAFVFLGSASGVASGNPTGADSRLESDQASAFLGESVAGAGDVNGDGYADVIVGADDYDAGQGSEGAAFVFLGGASGIVALGNPGNAHAQLESNQAAAFFGESVAGAGDVNGDGYADVIVGSNAYDAGELNEGAAFVFHGGASGIADGNPATAAAQLESDQASAQLGLSAAGAGDVNGDGYADVIAGAPIYNAGSSQEGAAFVFLGSASGIAGGDPGSAAAQLESDQGTAQLGTSVAGAGDVNGDGYADVIVGAPLYDGGQTNQGAAFVFHGSAAGIADGNPTTAAAHLERSDTSAELGVSVAGAGDVNGDGYADVIVGAHRADDGSTEGGSAYFYLGNGDRAGRPVRAQQLRAIAAIPIEPWGRTHSKTVFRARLQATHPEGRGRVKLHVEYCPPGVAFGHGSCGSKTSTSWTDVTPPLEAVTLTESVTGLANNTNYRWRARVLHAPFSVTQAGITAPPKPAHGPWRRVGAQSVEADLRTRSKKSGGCGLGFELALLLPALGWLQRRRH